MKRRILRFITTCFLAYIGGICFKNITNFQYTFALMWGALILIVDVAMIESKGE